jgi:hypothetical protein
MKLLASAPLCVACLNAKPNVPHVDFEAAFDGPVILTEAGDHMVTPQGERVQCEWLVLCEHCVRQAAEIAAITPQLQADLQREALEAKQLAIGWQAYAEGLEKQLGHRPTPKARPGGRPIKKPERSVA